jgi:hypothetical protein
MIASSPILFDPEMGGGGGGSGSGGDQGMDGDGIDPNMDPELAMVIHDSLCELLHHADTVIGYSNVTGRCRSKKRAIDISRSTGKLGTIIICGQPARHHDCTAVKCQRE